MSRPLGAAAGPGAEAKVEELQRLLHGIGFEHIWRPVSIPGFGTLCPGVGDADDGLAKALPEGLFHGQRVIDLGCNLGYYSFLAARAGAQQVLGVDRDPLLIKGCGLIKDLLAMEEVEFQCADLTTLVTEAPFDVGMMIDLVGKETIRCGLLAPMLDALARLSRRQMLLSLRPTYRIDKHLGGDEQPLLSFYPRQVLRHGHFQTLDYLVLRFATDWRIEQIQRRQGSEEKTVKETILLTRIS